MKNIDNRLVLQFYGFEIAKVPLENDFDKNQDERMCFIMELMEYDLWEVAKMLKPLISENPKQGE